MKVKHLVSIGGEHYYWQEEAEQMYFKEQGLLVPIPPSYGSLINHVQIESEEELDVEAIKDL
jgi:hypothetical protein|tara:strand:+ start:1223 stop:1408 length:186 start_codon:yes stop_codon:yes gene_type:complete